MTRLFSTSLAVLVLCAAFGPTQAVGIEVKIDFRNALSKYGVEPYAPLEHMGQAAGGVLTYRIPGHDVPFVDFLTVSVDEESEPPGSLNVQDPNGLSIGLGDTSQSAPGGASIAQLPGDQGGGREIVNFMLDPMVAAARLVAVELWVGPTRYQSTFLGNAPRTDPQDYRFSSLAPNGVVVQTKTGETTLNTYPNQIRSYDVDLALSRGQDGFEGSGEGLRFQILGEQARGLTGQTGLQSGFRIASATFEVTLPLPGALSLLLPALAGLGTLGALRARARRRVQA